MLDSADERRYVPSALAHATRPPPSPLSRFVPRASDLERLDEAMANGTIVCVTGAAGVGKTRLTHEWVRARKDSVGTPCFVDLAEARTLLDVAHALARVLGAAVPSDASDESALAALSLVDAPNALLVLDNGEGCRDALAAVLLAIDKRAIVTSRIRLGVDGERVVTVEPLPVDTLARELFLDRAKALGAEVDPDAPSLAALLAELEGVPLAIELAAARARLLPIAQLLERVRASKLDVLRRPLGGDDSLRARYEWSWELLTPVEAEALASLAVFAKAFDLDAAEAVVGDLDAIQSLREHHVIRDVGAGRHALFDGLRELAILRGDAVSRAAAERRHARWFADRATALGGALRTPRAREALAELERCEADLRLAVERARNPDEAARAFEGLAALRQRQGPAREVAAMTPSVDGDDAAAARVALARGYLVAEIDPRLARSLCIDAMTRGAGAVACFARAQVAVLSTRLADHETAAREATAVLDDPAASEQERARAWYVRAIVESSADAPDEAKLRHAMGAALDQAARSGDPALDARTQLVVAMIEHRLGSGDVPLQALERARAACLEAGDLVAACIARMTRASALVETLPVDAAIAHLGDAVDEASRLGMVTLAAHGLWQRALLRLSCGHVELAESDLAESAAGFASSPMASVCTAGLACARAIAGEAMAARALLASIDGAATAGFDSTRVLADAARAILGDAAAPAATSTARGPRVAHVLAERLVAVPRERRRETLACHDNEFTVEGTIVSLAGKRRLLLLYRALVAAHVADAARFVERRELLDAVWAGEKIVASAATNRLNVALSSLRRLGLPIETDARGVRLSPLVRVVTD